MSETSDAPMRARRESHSGLNRGTMVSSFVLGVGSGRSKRGKATRAARHSRDKRMDGVRSLRVHPMTMRRAGDFYAGPNVHGAWCRGGEKGRGIGHPPSEPRLHAEPVAVGWNRTT